MKEKNLNIEKVFEQNSLDGHLQCGVVNVVIFENFFSCISVKVFSFSGINKVGNCSVLLMFADSQACLFRVRMMVWSLEGWRTGLVRETGVGDPAQ